MGGCCSGACVRACAIWEGAKVGTGLMLLNVQPMRIPAASVIEVPKIVVIRIRALIYKSDEVVSYANLPFNYQPIFVISHAFYSVLLFESKGFVQG
jgi:hypothetical protein